MNVLTIILTELWMDEHPKCPVRDKTNTEESPATVVGRDPAFIQPVDPRVLY